MGCVRARTGNDFTRGRTPDARYAAPEIIVPGVTGWLFAPGNATALANALEQALDLDQEGRIRLADAAIARARALFDKADMCAKTLAVYDEVISEMEALKAS